MSVTFSPEVWADEDIEADEMARTAVQESIDRLWAAVQSYEAKQDGWMERLEAKLDSRMDRLEERASGLEVAMGSLQATVAEHQRNIGDLFQKTKSSDRVPPERVTKAEERIYALEIAETERKGALRAIIAIASAAGALMMFALQEVVAHFRGK